MEWIKIEDGCEMPKDEQKVRLKYETGAEVVSKYFYTCGFEPYVTHWQPFPGSLAPPTP